MRQMDRERERKRRGKERENEREDNNTDYQGQSSNHVSHRPSPKGDWAICVSVCL